ncbi:MAG: hypothetical protein R8K50_03140 [Mariprofundus sp.]
MQDVDPKDSAILADNGLNLQAVFNIAGLPPDLHAVIEAVEATADYHQLLVFGHGGRRMWQALSTSQYMADTTFTPTALLAGPSPCTICPDKPCISACPVALPSADIPLDTCINERLSDGSACANSCLARCACPIMAEQRYSDEQIAYHYGRSLEMICHNSG